MGSYQRGKDISPMTRIGLFHLSLLLELFLEDGWPGIHHAYERPGAGLSN